VAKSVQYGMLRLGGVWEIRYHFALPRVLKYRSLPAEDCSSLFVASAIWRLSALVYRVQTFRRSFLGLSVTESIILAIHPLNSFLSVFTHDDSNAARVPG